MNTHPILTVNSLKTLRGWLLIKVFHTNQGAKTEGVGMWADGEGGVEVSHHLGVTFHEKVYQGASHGGRAGDIPEGECAPAAVSVKRLGKGSESRPGFGGGFSL